MFHATQTLAAALGMTLLGALAAAQDAARLPAPPGQSAPAAAPAAVVREVGRFSAKDIDESSGLVASRRHPGILYTHNDSGGAPVIYAVKADGALIKAYRVPAKHTDWEDIAIDDAGRLYVANTGNNNVKRDSVEVFRLAEPALSEKGRGKKSKAKKTDTRAEEARLRVERTWKLRFPGEPFDCESLFVHGRHGYLVSKMAVGERAAVYRFPIDTAERELTLEKVVDLSVRLPVTGADVSADGKRMALVTAGAGAALYLYDIDGDVASAGRAEPRRVPLPPLKIEAVAFTPDGILMTAETREIYRYGE